MTIIPKYPALASRSFLSLSALAVASSLIAGCGGGGGGSSNPGGGGGGGGNNGTIVFVSNRDGNNEIYRMASDGSAQTRLTNSTGSDFNPSINRARTQVVFASNRDGNNEIYKLTLATNQLQRFTADGSDVDDIKPVFSPDGNSIAWISERGGQNNIWIMNATGDNQRQVTSTGANEVTWSPTGTQVAYVRNNLIVLRDAFGTNESTLVTSATGISNLRWNPNNDRQFLFTRGTTLFIYDSTFRTETTVAPLNTSSVYNGSWSPNSANVLWQANRASSTDTTGADQIYLGTVTLGTNTPTRLTTIGTNTEPAWAE